MHGAMFVADDGGLRACPHCSGFPLLPILGRRHSTALPNCEISGLPQARLLMSNELQRIGIGQHLYGAVPTQTVRAARNGVIHRGDAGARRAARGGWVVVLAILVGATAAAYMTYESLRFLRNGETGNRLCSFTKWINCDASVTSSYAFVFGVPVAWGALLFFAAMTCLLLLAKWRPARAAAATMTATALSVGGALVSATMLALLVFSIKAVCLPCLVIQISSFVLCGMLIARFRRLARPRVWSSAAALLLAAPALYAEGFAAFPLVQEHFAEPKPVNVAQEIQQYYSEPKQIDDTGAKQILAGWTVRGGPGRLGEPSLPRLEARSDGKVEILCFVDYQCPACRRVASLLPGWLGDLRTNCSIVHAQFPLDAAVNPYKPEGKHLQAGLAAKAALCFQRLGVSELLEREMFRSQDDLNLAAIMKLAANAGVNTNNLLAMMESDETRNALRRQIDLAHAAGVSATPTVFIDGRVVRLNCEPAVIRGIVAAELHRQVQP